MRSETCDSLKAGPGGASLAPYRNFDSLTISGDLSALWRHDFLDGNYSGKAGFKYAGGYVFEDQSGFDEKNVGILAAALNSRGHRAAHHSTSPRAMKPLDPALP